MYNKDGSILVYGWMQFNFGSTDISMEEPLTISNAIASINFKYLF